MAADISQIMKKMDEFLNTVLPEHCQNIKSGSIQIQMGMGMGGGLSPSALKQHLSIFLLL